MKWIQSAPSNIAIIKYMGKRDHERNIPINKSISWTLNHLRSFVELELTNGDTRWEPLNSSYPFELSEKGWEKFSRHILEIKKIFNIKENFIIRSANNFPSDCGIASSASSFAALTKVCVEAFSEISKGNKMSIHEQAMLSAKGSGSSCRSFHDGLVAWTENGIEVKKINDFNFYHQVVITSGAKKEVSSSEAHKRVNSSLLINGRIERAEKRYVDLISSLESKNWQSVFNISWAEFWDMHALFETSCPPFGYMSSQSLEILDLIKNYWKKNSFGPVTTMDAGPNVHLLWPIEYKNHAIEFKNFNTQLKFISEDLF